MRKRKESRMTPEVFAEATARGRLHFQRQDAYRRAVSTC